MINENSERGNDTMSEIRSFNDVVDYGVCTRKEDFSNCRKIFNRIAERLKKKSIIIRPMREFGYADIYEIAKQNLENNNIDYNIKKEKGISDYFVADISTEGLPEQLICCEIERMAEHILDRIFHILRFHNAKEIQFERMDIYTPFLGKTFDDGRVVMHATTGTPSNIDRHQIYTIVSCKFNLFDKEGKIIECCQ